MTDNQDTLEPRRPPCLLTEQVERSAARIGDVRVGQFETAKFCGGEPSDSIVFGRFSVHDVADPRSDGPNLDVEVLLWP